MGVLRKKFVVGIFSVWIFGLLHNLASTAAPATGEPDRPISTLINLVQLLFFFLKQHRRVVSHFIMI